MGFYEMVRGRWAAGRLVCVGLDPDPVRLPSAIRGSDARRTADFCRAAEGYGAGCLRTPVKIEVTPIG
ncbi:hypothetical protein SAMN05216284_12339 [Micromonospora sediminimaris]|uniref:Orotidine-5'-phosphate decarboxylase n=1 Tax=Micromonospora sediminimaris TaxID=547162 RepID=A0A9W5UVS1_9ACTN|nr:hypothetical protein Vse01_44110 [Micromonospora sediminimaris]SFD73408.1 hypothetical protein SAMN05216284_12339 [Micromonospora sediminimaris]